MKALISNATNFPRITPNRYASVFLLLVIFAIPCIHAQDTSSSQDQTPAPEPSPISASSMLSNPDGVTGFKFSVDGGTMSTQFGNTALKASNYAKRNSGYMNVGLGFDYALKYYTNGSVYTGAKVDFDVPFDMSDATGNPLDFGIMGGIFGEYRGVSVGTGIEARQFSLPAQGNFFRNAQLLYGIPVLGEVHVKRAMVQGGGTFWFGNVDGGILNNISNTDDDGDVTVTTVNNTVSMLSAKQNSYDVKFAAGYRVTDSMWLRFNYLKRQVHFDLADETGSNDPYIMDFSQNQYSGGIYFDLKF